MLLPSQAPTARLTAWFMRRTAPSAVRRVAPLKAVLASDVGMTREENQDRVALVRSIDRNGSPFILAALADGIGGMKQGAECAALTLATFIDAVICEAQHAVDAEGWLRKASHEANRAVHARQGGYGGSTLAAILFAKGYPALWLSVGDSRVYHVTEAKMTQLSKDDTLEGQLGKQVEGGRRSELLQFVGIGDGLEPHIEPVPLYLSGTLMLTSDGVHFINADYLGKVAHYAQDLGVCARRFMELARMLGGPDNASVVALGVDALSAASAPEVDSAYEVWDPFGELHVIVDHYRSYPSKASSRAPASATVDEGSPALSGHTESEGKQARDPAPVEAPAKRKPSKQKGRGNRKAKEKDVKGESEDERQADGEAPQLFIEFPHKAP